ncbi:MAG: uroporphyrinogen-III C-methyltransferase [Rhodoferax sp.]|nr:uroporphyrinogen-III C-methyltransferase [Rhodoferax sp.]
MNTPADAPLDTDASLAPVTQREPAAATAAVAAPVAQGKGARPWLLALAGLCGLALLSSGLLWQKLANIQEQLARQSADTTVQAVEARTLARQALELSRESAGRLTVLETRLSEVTLQRSQLEELMQSLSRSRDENLVVDIESALRLAQQQAQLTGSVEPLLAALKSADQRVVRAAQPRLNPLQRAITRDIDRVKSATVSDTAGLLVKLDELVHLADEVPLANALAQPRPVASLKRQANEPVLTWWERSLQVIRDEARGLVRVNRIEQPEAVLLSPEQSFFVRENLKLMLLNARLGLLARQFESSRADLGSAGQALAKYFDASSRRTQAASALLQQVQGQMKSMQLPRIDETLTALSTAAAGR